MNVVDRARMLAEIAHRGQVDKAGRPYILHPMAVANMVTTEQEKVVALLHDVIEDVNITAGFIRDVFGEEIAIAVKVLTHDPSESYTAYIRRIKEHPLAKVVKLADLSHNLQVERLPQITERDKARIHKYQRARKLLLEG